MMQKRQQELSVVRKPSAQEVAERSVEARCLKRNLEAWSSLVEFRIHLESALSLGHRLPVGTPSASFRSAEASVEGEAQAVAAQTREVLGSMLALMGSLAECRELAVAERKASLQMDQAVAASAVGEAGQRQRRGGEPAAWSTVDTRLQLALDWALGVADDWKERTRLDSRRAFKVLDQSLRIQMQALAEAEPAKLRRRCTPPPGKHSVFGAAATSLGHPSPEAAAGEGDLAGHGATDQEEAAAQDIFDDRDFYVQLLREMLAAGGSSGSGGVGLAGDDAAELRAKLQGRRAAKRQKLADVERRASKGRKIRYVPIEKLQNFMAPRPRSDGPAIVGPTVGVTGTPQPNSWVDAMLHSLFAKPRAV